MIPALGLLIACYGTARLVNDALARFPGNQSRIAWISTLLTLGTSAAGVLAMWFVMAALIATAGRGATP